MKKFHDAGLKVMNVNGTVKHARSAEAGGLDAVVAQGTEAGGHTGRVAGLAPSIEALLQYIHEQGLTTRRIKLDELFAPSTLRDIPLSEGQQV